MLSVSIVPILTDNYSYILHNETDAAIIDPGEPAPIEHALKEMGLTPSLILNTHHHADHIAGNRQLKLKYGCTVIGPAADKRRMPDMDEGVKEGQKIAFGGDTLRVIETPGHTSGHVCFFAETSHILFSGDTLFSMGCGRLLEGTAAEMFSSLQKLLLLPGDTKIYCGHEYTQSNGEFAFTIEKNNPDIRAHLEEARKLTANGQPTLPTTLTQEMKTNIFLRAANTDDFAALRKKKDVF